MPNAGYLDHLFDIIESRKNADTAESYVARLFEKGRQKIAQKVGEEGVEVAIAATANDRDGIVNESADLLFHLLILLADANIKPEEVLAEMQRREGQSGLMEKQNRGKP